MGDREVKAPLQMRSTRLDHGAEPKVERCQSQALPMCNFEDVISAMGVPGRYQIIQCILLSANMIPVVFINMNFVFIGLEPSFSCSAVNETTLFPRHSVSSKNNAVETTYRVVYDQCEIRVISNASGHDKTTKTMNCIGGYSYNGGNHVSVKTEWDLVCDRIGTAELTQSMMSLGWFIGLFLTSVFSDKFGRKKTIIIAVAGAFLSELFCTFASSIYVMIGLRFFSGLFGAGITSTTYVLGAELFMSRHRETFNVYLGLIWSTLCVWLCAIAYAFRDNSWRDLQLCLALGCALPLLSMCFVDESASWLYSKGEHSKAARILKTTCRQNGVDFVTIRHKWDKLCEHQLVQEEGGGTNKKSAKDYNIVDLFRNGRLRMAVLVAWVVSLSNDVAYYGLYLSAAMLVGNLYLNTTLMAVLEFPGYCWALVMLRYKGRKFVTIFFMSMGAACLLVSTCVDAVNAHYDNYTLHMSNTSTAFFLLGRLAIANSYLASYLYIPELFPTTLRSSGFGLALTGCCVGGVLAPYLLPLHALVPWVPGSILVGVLTVSVLLLLKLPETKGRHLVSIIVDESDRTHTRLSDV